MKTKFIVMAAMAAMFSMGFTACSNNDEEMSVKALDKDPILFSDIHAKGLAHVTRGYATTAANALNTITSFQTWGYDDTNDVLYMGDNATTGRVVSNADPANPVWSYTPRQFWPVNALNFVAVTPSAAPTGGTLTHSTASASNVVTLTSAFVNPTTVANQVDLMYAKADGITKAGIDGDAEATADNGNVPFTFEHALSQVVFKGKLPSNGTVTKVTVAEISLCNIKSAGTLVYTSEGTWFDGTNAYPATSGTPATFTLAATEAVAGDGAPTAAGDFEGYVFEAGTGGIVAGTAFDLTTSNNATKKNAWFMVPQRTDAWAGPAAIGATPASGAYLKIRAKLEKNGVPVLNATTADAFYIPLTANWDRNKKYIYTIEFNGSQALTPITFSVAAQDWGDDVDTGITM